MNSRNIQNHYANQEKNSTLRSIMYDNVKILLTFLQVALEEQNPYSSWWMTMLLSWSCTHCSYCSQIAPLCILELSPLSEHHFLVLSQKTLHHKYHQICCTYKTAVKPSILEKTRTSSHQLNIALHFYLKIKKVQKSESCHCDSNQTHFWDTRYATKFMANMHKQCHVIFNQNDKEIIDWIILPPQNNLKVKRQMHLAHIEINWRKTGLFDIGRIKSTLLA